MAKKDIVINFIKEQINSGYYKPGKKIMSEPLLAERFSVCRNTVREAIKDLTDKGILEKKPGSGTYLKDDYVAKYVVLSLKQSYFIHEIDTFFKTLVEDITRLLNEAGYKVYTNFESHLDKSLNLPIDIKDIAGLISMNGNEELYKDLEKNNIPIVSLFNRNSLYPSVTKCFNDFYLKLDYLINEYKLQKILFLNYDREFRIWDDDLIDYAMIRYYGDKYLFCNINQSIQVKYITKEIDSYFKTINEPVDAVIFLYDTLYVQAQVLFPKYDWLKDVKIITHSNNDETYQKEYKICRLTYYIRDFSSHIVDFLIKLINKEKLIHTAYHVKCDIIGQENLRG